MKKKIKDSEIVNETIDIEPRWENICRAAQAGTVNPIELMPACKIADIIRQAQKNEKKSVTFKFENGEVFVIEK